MDCTIHSIKYLSLLMKIFTKKVFIKGELIIKSDNNKNMLKTKTIFTLFSMAVLVFTFSFGIVDAQTPEFNNHPNDHKTLRLKNRTQGTVNWTTPISANSGDRISFDVYYHNNIDGSVAKNTKVRIDYPCNDRSIIRPTAYISADNVSTVSDTARINVNSPQKLVFDSVAKWYPDQKTTHTNISITQVGSCSVEVDIGDIEGCWPYQGHVVFDATLTDDDDSQGNLSCYSSTEDSIRLSYDFTDGSDVSLFRGNTRIETWSQSSRSGRITDTGLSPNRSYTYYLRDGRYTSSPLLDRVTCRTSYYEEEEEDLTVTKRVKSVERDTIYLSSLNASPGELINYSIRVSARDARARDVVVKDALPSNLSYAGNLRVDGVRVSGNIGSGIDIGDIRAGEYKTVTFDVRVAPRDHFVIGTTSMTNVARATSENDSTTGRATVHVKRERATTTPTEVPTGISGNTVLDYIVLPFLLALLIFILFRKHFIALTKKLEEVRKEVRAEW